MKHGRWIASFAATLLFLIGCGGKTGQPAISQTIASVDGKTISVEDFERSYVDHLIGSGNNDTYDNRYRHLRAMIDNVLLADEAVRRGLDSDSLYKSYRTRESMKALGARFFETQIAENLDPPTEGEVRMAFLNSKDKVVVRHLFYRSKLDADEAFARIAAGEDFVDEAQRCYNTVEYDSSAGFLGPMSYFTIDDAFAEAAFALDVGQISEPVRSRVGYHIIRVEERIKNPLLTESEFQTRRQGITERVRIRQRRLTGDSFVRDYMTNLNVAVNPEGIAALNVAIKAIENRVEDAPVQLNEQLEVAPFDLGDLAETFSPATVLATYSYGGETLEFTAGDYYFWLRDLPFQEASNRTAASVGRALRNDVLARASIDAGLQDDEKVLHDIDLSTRIYLASALRVYLGTQPETEPDDELVRNTFEGLGLSQKTTWTGSFTVIPASSFAEARQIENALERNERSASDYSDAFNFDDVDLSQINDWGRNAIRSPVADPTVVVLDDNTAGVVIVSEKSSVEASFDDYREMLRERLLPFVNEYNTINRLRETQSVEVDSTLFELIMDLDSGIN